jgi:hypothetical protein
VFDVRVKSGGMGEVEVGGLEVGKMVWKGGLDLESGIGDLHYDSSCFTLVFLFPSFCPCLERRIYITRVPFISASS